MEENTVKDENVHFPLDKDAPVKKDTKLFDIVIFSLILFSTAITVSLSLYIIITKYF